VEPIANYQEWERRMSDALKADALWSLRAYRLSLFVSDLCWSDAQKLERNPVTRPLSGQLYRAVCSIGANVAEGYSMSTGKNRARYYEYALGSAREARDWYTKARHTLGPEVSEHRLSLLTQIIKLLLSTIPQQRTSTERLHEQTAPYSDADNTTSDT
jgi:four helix bundle protein